jgi:hypothetical protein
MKNKTVYLTYSYSIKISSKAEKKGCIYSFIVKNVQTAHKSHEKQIFDDFDYWALEEKCYSHVKSLVEETESTLFFNKKEALKDYLLYSVFYDYLRFIYLEKIKKRLLDEGFSKVKIVDIKHYAINQVYSKRDSSLYFKVVFLVGYFFKFIKSIFQECSFKAPKKDALECENIFLIYDSRQDYFNSLELMKVLDKSVVWLSTNKENAATKEINSTYLQKYVTKLKIRSIGPLIFRYVVWGARLLSKPNFQTYFFIKMIYGLKSYKKYKDSFEELKGLKNVFGSLHAKNSSILLYLALDEIGVKLVNYLHGCTTPNSIVWRFMHFHLNLVPSKYLLEAGATQNDSRSVVLGLYTMDRVKKSPSKELEEFKGDCKILSVIGAYFTDIPLLGNPKEAREMLYYVRKIMKDKPGWKLLVRPRVGGEQYSSFVKDVFEDFPKDRILIDHGENGKYSLSEVLSYSDVTVIGMSSSIFEAIKLNVPIVKVNFGVPKRYYDILCEEKIVYGLTRETESEFREIFDSPNDELEKWLDKWKPQRGNWKRYLDVSEESFATRLKSIMDNP